MEILILLVFVSLMLALASVVMFNYTLVNHDYSVIEQLSLKPLEEDDQ